MPRVLFVYMSDVALVAPVNDSLHNDRKLDAWVGWGDIDKMKYMGLLSGVGAIGGFVSHPFFVMTTRQQAGSRVTGDGAIANDLRGVCRGVIDNFRRLGVRGMLRGFIPLTVLGVPSNLIYFGATEASREYIRSELQSWRPTMSPLTLDIYQSIITASLANFFSLIPYVPAEVIASRMIVQHPSSFNSLRSSCADLYRAQGVGGFFRGFNSSFLSGSLHSASWWMAYSICRRYTASCVDNPVYVDSISGAVAGTLSTIITHPLDTLRTRIMIGTSDTSMMRAVRHIIATEGGNILWKGLFPSLAQSGVCSMIFALSYELIKRTALVDNFEKYE